MARENFLYKISYDHQGTVHEIYAKYIAQSEIWGFIEIEGFIFGDNAGVVIDPGEEKLKNEFKNVTCSYIPVHTIIRIDRVTQSGTPKIIKNSEKPSNVTTLSPHFYSPKQPSEE